MVLSKHIDYNISCTGVFRMCLMVIDMCIDKTFGFLPRFTLIGATPATLIPDQTPRASCFSRARPLTSLIPRKGNSPWGLTLPDTP
jgi:hypothetical protein